MEEVIYWMLDEEIPGPVPEPPAFLAPEEFTRFAQMRFSKRRAEWLHGRRTAKTLLCYAHPACAALSLREIVIKNEPGGMPYPSLASGERLPCCLSISHRDELAVSLLVLASYLRIGVDIEKVEPRHNNFVEDFFTPSEIERVSISAAEDRPKMVTLIWSAKEAALKALGQGLRLDTRSVDINISAGDEISTWSNGWNRFEVTSKFIPGDDWNGMWRFRRGYVFTVAIIQPDCGRKYSNPGFNLREVQPGL